MLSLCFCKGVMDQTSVVISLVTGKPEYPYNLVGKPRKLPSWGRLEPYAAGCSWLICRQIIKSS